MSVIMEMLVRSLRECYVTPIWPNDLGIRPGLPLPGSKGVVQLFM